jgi:hypothetical protein
MSDDASMPMGVGPIVEFVQKGKRKWSKKTVVIDHYQPKEMKMIDPNECGTVHSMVHGATETIALLRLTKE